MYRMSESNALPESAILETLPNGGIWVILHRNIEQTENPGEDGTAQIIYRAEEVTFRLPAGREETAESIAASLDDWWLYGEGWTPRSDDVPTTDERLTAVEAIAAIILDGGLR